jgi:hypothetical protein
MQFYVNLQYVMLAKAQLKSSESLLKSKVVVLASKVRGNHDDAALAAAYKFRGKGKYAEMARIKKTIFRYLHYSD